MEMSTKPVECKFALDWWKIYLLLCLQAFLFLRLFRFC